MSFGVDISTRGDIFGYFCKSWAIFRNLLVALAAFKDDAKKEKKILRALLEKSDPINFYEVLRHFRSKLSQVKSS